MPRWHLVRTVFRKELREGLRDRHTLLITYVLPLILYPLALLWLVEVVSIEQNKISGTIYRVGVAGRPPDGLADQFRRHRKEVAPVPLEGAHDERIALLAGRLARASTRGQARADLRQVLKQNRLNALVLSQPVAGRPDAGATHQLIYFYDDSDLASTICTRVVRQMLQALSGAARDARLREHGLSLEVLYPIAIEGEDVSDVQAVVARHSGSIVAYLLLIFMCLCAYYPALNATAGERERGTLSTLLCTPARARELVLGKYFSVLFFSVAGVAMYALEPVLSATLLAPKLNIRPLPNPWWVLTAPVLATAALVSAISMCVGLNARRVTEGQAFLSVTMIALLFPTAVAAISDTPLSSQTALLPIFNLSLILKYFTQDPLPMGQLLICSAVNLSLALALVGLAVNSLENEALAEPGVSEVLSLDRKVLRHPNPALSTILFLLILGGTLCLNLLLRNHSLLLTVLLTHVGLLFLLPALALRFFRIRLATAIPRQGVPLTGYAGAALVALGCATLMLCLSAELPFSKELGEALGKRLAELGGGRAGSLLLLFTLAVLPGIFEELAFRGFLFTGIARGFSPLWTIVITSLMFGLNHFSLVRFVPTTVIGLALGLMVWRTRSIYPAIVMHTLYNGLLVFAGATLVPPGRAPLVSLAGGGAALLLGLLLAASPWKKSKQIARKVAPGLRLAK